MLCADAAAPRGARSARARETCRGRTEPRRCPAAQRERVAAVTAVSAHFLPFALLPDVAEKAEHQGDRHRRCVQPTHSRAAFACTAHSRPPRDAPAWPRARWTPRLQSLGSTERRRARPACVRVGCEGGGKLSWARAQRPRLPGRSSCRSVECRWVRTGTPSPLAPGHRAPPAVTRSSRP